MPHDHLVRRQALLDYKKWILHSYHIGIFSKGLSHDFGQNLKLLICMFLDKMDIKIEFDDHLVKEQDHLDKKY